MPLHQIETVSENVCPAANPIGPFRSWSLLLHSVVMFGCFHVLSLHWSISILFQQPLKKKKIKMEPCWDAQSNPLPRQGSLCAAKPNGWVAIFFRASSSSHPSPGGGTMQTQRLGCCSGLWLMHMQVGEYNISFQFSEPLGSWEPGIQPLSSNTGAPQACWSSTAQQLGVGSCSAGSICCALGKEVGESAATTWNVVPISSSPCPVEALSPCLLTAATL